MIDYLRTIPGADGLTNPFAGASVTRKIPEIKTWKPTFVIVSIGQFGAKPVLVVKENGAEKNLTVGDFVENREIIKIDVEDESSLLKTMIKR